MRKIVFSMLFCLALLSGIVYGEGDRKYSKCYARLITGAQTTITPPWSGVWRFDIIQYSSAAGDTSWVKITQADGDTTLVRLGLSAQYIGGATRIPFYGPNITSVTVKAWGTSRVTMIFWK